MTVYSVNHCALAATKFQDFSSLRLNGSWNRGLMRRFITCSHSTLCHWLVAVCNLKNVLQSVVALSFAVSSLFLVFSRKFLIIVISTDGKGKLVPFHVIHLEWRYSIPNNNVGIKWKWVVHLKTPSLYSQVRNPWYPCNRKLGGLLFWLDVLEKLKVLYCYWDFNPWFVWPVALLLYLLY
jgi:hypothetical protein